MDKKIILLLVVILSLLLILVNAEELTLKETISETKPCLNRTCSFTLDEIEKFAKYEVNNRYEISERLVHKTTEIYFKNIPPMNLCMYTISLAEHPYIYNLNIYKNESIVKAKPYVSFHPSGQSSDGRPKKIANFPCFYIESGEIVVLDYYQGGEIKPYQKTINLKFIKIKWPEFIFPFDKYEFTSWYGTSKVYFKRFVNVILPPTFEANKEKSHLTCPYVLRAGFEKAGERFLTMTLFADITSYEGTFVQSDEKNIIVFPDVMSPPKDWAYQNSILLYNMTKDSFENTHDQRTGCYLSLKYQRTQIVIFFFLVATILISLISVYNLWFYDDKVEIKFKNRLLRLSSSTFVVWSFLEGLNSLTPLSRPTTITLFDLVLLLPIIFIIIYFWRNIATCIFKVIKLIIKIIVLIIKLIIRFCRLLYKLGKKLKK